MRRKPSWASAGETVLPGVPVMKLLQIGTVKVRFSVPEQEIAAIGADSRMRITVPALGDRTCQAGKIEKGAVANPAAHTYDVRAALANAGGELLPGMVCRVEVSPAGATGFLYACISSRVMEQAIQRGIDAGVKAAMEHIRTEREKERKSRQDRRLHNTRLLLKNYRLLKEHTKGAIFRANQARERAVDILDGLNDYEMDDGLYIESIKKSQQRTLIILAHIDQMLELYKAYCYNSGNPENIRRYGVVMATYIDEPKKSALEIAGTFGIEKRTVYKDIKAAANPLTALLFGIDSLRME